MADSFNELMGLGSHSADAALAGWWPMQDDAANKTVVDQSGNSITGTLQGGDNTSDKSTTGPNGWLAKAFAFNGTDDYVSLPGSSLNAFGNEFTFSCWCWVDSSLASSPVIFGQSNTNDAWHIELRIGDNSIGVFEPGTNVAISNASAFSDDEWFHLVYRRSGTGSGTHAFYVNGVSVGLATDGSADFTNTTATKQIGQRGNSSQYLLGSQAGLSVFTGALTAGEIGQLQTGPEPVVTSGSDTLSGTAQVGETLSVSAEATWGLPSPFASGTNGTITYSYQWTRSDDNSGTNEADISGATSSTYTLQGADAGKYIRRRRRASNTGGYDSAADTHTGFSGQVEAAKTPWYYYAQQQVAS